MVNILKLLKRNKILKYKMNLCVIVLTSNLYEEKPKTIPKVCANIGEKSMLEICLENVIQLNPKKIILMVSKNHILYINKLIKHANYSKLISYCIFKPKDERKMCLAKKCYSGHDVLVIPGNAPLLTTKSLYRIISEKRTVKINKNIFYVKKENLDDLKLITEYPSEKLLSEEEILQIETKEDLNFISEIFEKKAQIHAKILKRARLKKY